MWICASAVAQSSLFEVATLLGLATQTSVNGLLFLFIIGSYKLVKCRQSDSCVRNRPLPTAVCEYTCYRISFAGHCLAPALRASKERFQGFRDNCPSLDTEAKVRGLGAQTKKEEASQVTRSRMWVRTRGAGINGGPQLAVEV